MSTTETSTALRRFEVLGTTDDWEGCDCCGRSGLKVYVVLRVVDESEDSGEVYRYGTGCAAKAEGIPAKTIRAEARDADADARRIKAAEAHARAEADLAEWQAWLNEQDPAHANCIPDQITALGGFATARAAYRAR
jgi:hypothetical protein